MSYNPKTGLVYIPAQQIPQGYLQDMDELDKRKVLGFNVGTSLNKTMLPDDVQAFRAEVAATTGRSVEHTSELQSLMRSTYAVFCLKKKKHITNTSTNKQH